MTAPPLSPDFRWSKIAAAFSKNPDGVLQIPKYYVTDGFSVVPRGSEHTGSSSTLSLRQCFNSFRGKGYIQKICRRAGIEWDESAEFVPNRENIGKIFVTAMNLHTGDIRSRAFSIMEPPYRIDLSRYMSCMRAFGGPTTSLRPREIDRVETSGKGFLGLVEKVSVILHHYGVYRKERDKNRIDCIEAEMLTSRLADREPKLDEVIPLSAGCFYVDRVFSGGGAYVFVLKQLNAYKALPDAEPCPKIVCRGTAMRQSATSGWMSGVNNVLLQVGTTGVKSIWPDLSRYLQEEGIGKVEVFGKSLGGAHAQQLTVLLESVAKITVKKLTTVCSVGVGEEISTLFRDKVLEGRQEPFCLHVIRNGGLDAEDSLAEDIMDYIPTVGGAHLGVGTDAGSCTIKVSYLYPSRLTDGRKGGETEINPVLKKGVFNLLSPFISSFSTAHCRQTTLLDHEKEGTKRDFTFIDIEGAREIQEHLRWGEQLEPLRRVLAYIIHVFTLFFLNGFSFTSYYEREAQGLAPRASSVTVM